jgi:hypothetical protein
VEIGLIGALLGAIVMIRLLGDLIEEAARVADKAIRTYRKFRR